MNTPAQTDNRTPEEKDWPIKAQCVVCAGKGSIQYNCSKHKCDRCHGRGYYFLPLGE